MAKRPQRTEVHHIRRGHEVSIVSDSTNVSEEDGIVSDRRTNVSEEEVIVSNRIDA
jgi:hypothetical protein